MDYNRYDQIYINNNRLIKHQNADLIKDQQDYQDHQDQLDNQEQEQPNNVYVIGTFTALIGFIIILASLYIIFFRYSLLYKSIQTKQYWTALALSSQELGLFIKSLLSFF
jgi:hypothetical protein